MVAFKPARVPAIAVILFALVLTLVTVVASVASPQPASAQGVPPYCAPGYVSNGVICVSGSGTYCPYPGYPSCSTGYGTCTSGFAGCINGVCQGGYSSNGAGGCTYTGVAYGTCTNGTAGCLNGICQGGYSSNGAGGCTYTGVAYGTCTNGTAGCINGICQGGYTPNGTGGCTYTGAAYGTCTNGAAGCVNGVCTSGYVSNGAAGCTYTGSVAGTCVSGVLGCINGVCTSGYVSNGASGCTLSGAGNCPAGTTWNGSACLATGAAIGAAPTQTALSVGCNLVVVAFGVGAVPQQVVTATAIPSAVQSVWGWDNARQRWMGFFPGQSSAASDLLTLSARAAVFVCVNSATTITAP